MSEAATGGGAPMALADPERRLALGYAAPAARSGLATLLALDARLGAIVRRASEPTIGLMRLTWWGEALAALDAGPPPAEPLLQAVAATGICGAELAPMVEGWALLLDGGPLDEEALADFGRERGGRLFVAMAVLSGGDDDLARTVGEGWALADLARHHSDRDVADRAAGMAVERLDRCYRSAWPRALRALGALGLLARSDLRGGGPGSPARVGRLLFHRLSGR